MSDKFNNSNNKKILKKNSAKLMIQMKKIMFQIIQLIQIKEGEDIAVKIIKIIKIVN